MKALITGVAGLIGSHLAEQLIARGDTVVGLDNFVTGRRENVEAMRSRAGFTLVEADVEDVSVYRSLGPVDAVWQLASPASPPDFARIPREILSAGSSGVLVTLDYALEHGASYVLASTSEVYGDPLVNPQPETYRGQLDPTGPRACYDEAKRFGEAAASSYARRYGLECSIVRIFNTYGPRMRADDGRVVSEFITRALQGLPLVVHGDGNQTRSFCYVDDLVAGLMAVLDTNEPGPINLGNPEEVTMLELAGLVLALTGAEVPVEFRPPPPDDPRQRRPDITLARSRLGWSPHVGLPDGLARVIDEFCRRPVGDEPTRAQVDLSLRAPAG